MQQRVQVVKIFPDGYAEVLVQRESACSGDCHKCSGCGAAKQQVFVWARNAIGARPGDKVIVSSDDRQIFPAMLVVYILPLVLLLAGYFAGLGLGMMPGITAAAGFAIGIVLMILYNRHVQTNQPVTFVITGYAEN